MRIVADEHIPDRFVTALQSEGFDVVRAKGVLYESAPDSAIRDYAVENGYVVLSEDEDFRKEVTDQSDHPGVIACNTRAKTGEVVSAIRSIERYAEDLSGNVVNVPGNWD